MTVRSYLRVLVALVLLNDCIRAIPVLAGADAFIPAIAGYLLGMVLDVVAAIGGLLGRRWGFVVLGALTGSGALVGLYTAARALSAGHGELATVGVLVCVAQFGIAMGLVFLNPDTAGRGLANQPQHPTSGGHPPRDGTTMHVAARGRAADRRPKETL